jgi:hypothetical protein
MEANGLLFKFAVLKRLLTILILSAYLVSATELYQLVKLPFLVSHFISHKQENPKISLWSFLCLHYANGEVFDKDHDDDMKLPFKSHESASHVNFVASVPPTNISIEKPFISQTRIYKCFNEAGPENQFPSGIWQPPKFI